VLLPYLALVVAAAAGVAASASETGARPVQLEFEAPDRCSGGDAFWSGLRSRTDRVRRADGNEPRTTLQVRLIRTRGQVVGELRMVDDRGGTDSRRVQGTSCDEVVQALSLTAALALDPSALVAAPASAPASTSTETGAASAVTASPSGAPADASTAAAGGGQTEKPTVAPVPASTERPHDRAAEAPAASSSRTRRPVPGVEFALGPVGLTVLSGSSSTGGSLAVRKNLGGDGVFSPSLGLAGVYVRNDVLRSPPSTQSSLAAFGATACPLRWTASLLTLQPCTFVLGGWLSATGRGVTHPSTVDRLWLSAGGTLRAAACLGAGLSLEVEAGASAPLHKRRFYVTVPTNVVAETPAISPIVGIALTYGL
jgi:hypothetical protein